VFNRDIFNSLTTKYETKGWSQIVLKHFQLFLKSVWTVSIICAISHNLKGGKFHKCTDVQYFCIFLFRIVYTKKINKISILRLSNVSKNIFIKSQHLLNFASELTTNFTNIIEKNLKSIVFWSIIRKVRSWTFSWRC